MGIRENPRDSRREIPRFAQPAKRRHLPLNCACLFSKNAVVHSLLSSVAHEPPNNTASRYNPASRLTPLPQLTPYIAYCTASGALPMIFRQIASARGITAAALTDS